jgi:hypothetical protein
MREGATRGGREVESERMRRVEQGGSTGCAGRGAAEAQQLRDASRRQTSDASTEGEAPWGRDNGHRSCGTPREQALMEGATRAPLVQGVY